MDADGACELRQPRDGRFHLFAGGHDQVGEFVDHKHDVRHVVVSESVDVLAVIRMAVRQPRNDLALGKLGVVLLDVPTLRRLEQLVALVHFHAQAVERGHHFAGVRDDRVFAVRQLRQVMAHNLVVQGEFHLLGVHQDKLQRRRVPAVQHAHQHGVQTDGLSLARGAGHEQVRHFGHVEDVGLVADGLAQGDGQFGVAVLELLAGDERAHADDVRVGVGHFDADGAFSWDGGDDADAQRRQAQGDVVLEVLDLADAHPRRRHDLVQRHRGPDLRRNLVDFDFEVLQGADDVVLVDVEFFRRDAVLAVAVVRQLVDVGQLELGQVQRWVKRPKLLRQIVQLRFGQHFLIQGFFHFERHVVLTVLCGLRSLRSHWSHVLYRSLGLLCGFRFWREGHFEGHDVRLCGFRLPLGLVLREQDVRGRHRPFRSGIRLVVGLTGSRVLFHCGLIRFVFCPHRVL